MALGRPVPSCAVRILVGFGKGKRLPRSPLRRSIYGRQARAAVLAATSRYFVGYTATPTQGVFFSEGEPGVAIDLYRTQYDPPDCRAMVAKAQCLAGDIRSVLRQHSVMVVAYDPRSPTPLTADIVTKSGGRACSRKASALAREAAIDAASRAI